MPIRAIINQQTYSRLKNFLVQKRIFYKSQLSEVITGRALSWTSFCQSNGLRTTVAPAAWFMLLQAPFPDNLYSQKPLLSVPIRFHSHLHFRWTSTLRLYLQFTILVLRWIFWFIINYI